MKDKLLDFLKNQKVLTLSTISSDNKPWISNVYFSVNNDLEFFFVSPLDTKHAQHIQDNKLIAFSTVWFDENNLSNRIAIQATGICTQIKNPIKTSRFLKNHYKFFPEWRDYLNLKNILSKSIESSPFVIKPNYIKFWSDELFGEEGVYEFTF